MTFTKIWVLEAMFALVWKGITNVLQYNENRPDFPMNEDQISSYMKKWVVVAIIWGIAGSLKL